LKPKRSQGKPDKRRMQAAVQAFLSAAGVDLKDPNLAHTARRVTDAWADEFLDGYPRTAAQALGERFPVSVKGKRELLVVTHLNFTSACPHHLLPYFGVAHVAYVPGTRVVGLGRLSTLLDTFAHRLILQEELARQVAQALVSELKSPGAACILEAQQLCLRLRGEEQHDAITHAEAYAGVLRKDSKLRDELWARIGARPKPQRGARGGAF
jgi:GTP cyclohydrolase IA